MMASETAFSCCRQQKKLFRVIIQIALLIVYFNGISEARSPLLHVKDNSYNNLVVGISSTVDKKAGHHVLEEIQKLLTVASQQLFIATKQHVYFKNITILLPSSWLNEPIKFLFKQATYETFEHADIQIEAPKRQITPYTKQNGGCGQRGLSINLSPEFLHSLRNETNLAANAKRFVREWAYFQYGVFEECGHPHSNLFPQFYYRHRKLSVTGCLTNPHDYIFQGNCSVTSFSGIPRSDCDFSPNTKTNSTSSLLTHPSLQQVKHFCDALTHNYEAPTKQNFLCKEKNAWDVIKSNSDFENLQPLLDPATNTTPTFRFVLTPNVTYVVLLDQSNPMKDNNKFVAVQTVLSRFFKDHIIDGSVVALSSFSNGADVIIEETFVSNEGDRNKIIGNLPENVHIAPLASITDGILTAANIFKPGSSMQQNRRVLVLITAGQWQPIDVTAMCEKLNLVRSRLMAVVCPDGDKPLNNETANALYSLAQCTHGSVFIIPNITQFNHPLTVERLDAAIRATLDLNELEDETVQILMEHFTESSDATLTGNFTVDKNVFDTVFRVSYENTKNVEKVTLTPPSGLIYDGAVDRETLGPSRAYYFDEMQPGLWKYDIKLYEHMKNSSVTVALIAESKQNLAITVKCWTNVQIVDGRTPVIIYAEVEQMNAPVINAKVVATIHVPSNATAPARSYQVSLYDTGNGDPDINENDGIYSRYLIDLPTSGLYAVDVTVNGIDGGTTRAATAISTELDLTSDCLKPALATSSTGTFTRFALAPSFYVPNPTYNSTYPPNRISDLRIHKVDPPRKQIQLQWSSSGDNLDSGEVPHSSYQIRYSDTRKFLRKEHFDKATKIELPILFDMPETTDNNKLSTIITLPESNALYYFAIKTINSNGYQSDVSNIVSAFLPSSDLLPLEVTTINSSVALGQTESPPKKSSGASTGPIIGIIVAVILILVIVVVIWRVTSNRRRRRKAHIMNNTHDYKRVPVTNEYVNPINEEDAALTSTVDETEESPVKKSPKKEKETRIDVPEENQPLNKETTEQETNLSNKEAVSTDNDRNDANNTSTGNSKAESSEKVDNKAEESNKPALNI